MYVYLYIFFVCVVHGRMYDFYVYTHACVCVGGRKGMKTGRDEVDQGKGKGGGKEWRKKIAGKEVRAGKKEETGSSKEREERGNRKK